MAAETRRILWEKYLSEHKLTTTRHSGTRTVRHTCGEYEYVLHEAVLALTPCEFLSDPGNWRGRVTGRRFE